MDNLRGFFFTFDKPQGRYSKSTHFAGNRMGKVARDMVYFNCTWFAENIEAFL